jgi:nucleotide-binding universal stress UspA family protein
MVWASLFTFYLYCVLFYILLSRGVDDQVIFTSLQINEIRNKERTMYDKILVPLDGSQYAQCSLEYTKELASGCKTKEVTILRVIEPLRDDETQLLIKINEDVIPKLEAKKKEEATEYVSYIAKRLEEEGLPARGEVIFGKPDEEIISYAEKNRFDLIVMSTHGRSGISKWSFGSVADRVAHYSKVPVMFALAHECRVAQG